MNSMLWLWKRANHRWGSQPTYDLRNPFLNFWFTKGTHYWLSIHKRDQSGPSSSPYNTTAAGEHVFSGRTATGQSLQSFKPAFKPAVVRWASHWVSNIEKQHIHQWCGKALLGTPPDNAWNGIEANLPTWEFLNLSVTDVICPGFWNTKTLDVYRL